MFNFIKPKFCYFVITNINRYMLNDLTKAYIIEIEEKFKKLIYNLIVRYAKKFNLVPQDNEISSLAIKFTGSNLFNIIISRYVTWLDTYKSAVVSTCPIILDFNPSIIERHLIHIIMIEKCCFLKNLISFG